MSTPVEIRNWRKSAQRAIRLGFNAFASSLDLWKSSIAEGKVVATELSNDYLEMVNIHALCQVGVLNSNKEKIHGAEGILKNRINSRIARRLKDLREHVDALEHAYEKMHSTLDELKSTLFDSRVMDDSNNNHFLHSVVFTTLTCRDILSSLELIVDMHGKELEIKRSVLNDYRCMSLKQSESSPKEHSSQEYWTLHITAWAMDVEISKEFVTSAMRQIARDASLTY